MVDKELGGLVKKEVDVSGTNHLDSIHSGYGQSDLSELTLVDLVIRFNQIDRQSQLFKGQILLEARNRFPSNVEFGKWLSVNFTELDTSNTGKLINLAKFFSNGRSLEGIPLSAGYLLASPGNEEVASDVYEEIKDKSLSLKEIKRIIEQFKNPVISVDTYAKNNSPESNSENVFDSNAVDEIDDDENDDEVNYVTPTKVALPHLQPTKYQIYSSLTSFTLEEKMVLLSLLNTSSLPVDANFEPVQLVADKCKTHHLLLTLGRFFLDDEILDAVNRLFLRSIILDDGFSEIRWVYEKQYIKSSNELRVRVHRSIIENAKDIVQFCKSFRYSWCSTAKLIETNRLYDLIVYYGILGQLFTLNISELMSWFGFCLVDDGSNQSFLEDVLKPAVDELNEISHLSIGFDIEWKSVNIPVRFSVVKKQPADLILSNQEIISLLMKWEDVFVVRDFERVKNTAEVFTPIKLVQDMLDELPVDVFIDPEKTFLDPACGNGQFLSEILIRKLQNDIDFPTALSTIFGYDIMPDNIQVCRDRLLCGMEQYRYIVEKNIICADALQYDKALGGIPWVLDLELLDA